MKIWYNLIQLMLRDKNKKTFSGLSLLKNTQKWSECNFSHKKTNTHTQKWIERKIKKIFWFSSRKKHTQTNITKTYNEEMKNNTVKWELIFNVMGASSINWKKWEKIKKKINENNVILSG